LGHGRGGEEEKDGGEDWKVEEAFCESRLRAALGRRGERRAEGDELADPGEHLPNSSVSRSICRAPSRNAVESRSKWV